MCRNASEKKEGRETATRAETIDKATVNDTGKAERKVISKRQAVAEKGKKTSIHERLETNKRIIQEKQGKDKPERGADRGVRTI